MSSAVAFLIVSAVYLTVTLAVPGSAADALLGAYAAVAAGLLIVHHATGGGRD